MGFVAGDQLVWSRWWGPEQAEIQLFGGVLPDPRDDYARFVNGHLKELKDFAACRALVLLGEPGAGKSFQLEKEILRRRSSGEHVEPILLREFLSASEVREAVRDTVDRWRKAGSPGDLTLAFDGFDEPLFAIGNLADACRCPSRQFAAFYRIEQVGPAFDCEAWSKRACCTTSWATARC
ncbi:hypothetical protein OHB14_61995 [Streptomyces sp. NBC_01613]|uniref:hypothetical protein n=1 Tax=Streptomyces sp. NBC_01613 TaxID=2975896 RepID=UPI003870E6C0